MYTTAIDAFLDLVIGMNNGLRKKVFRFRDNCNCNHTRHFERMLQSISLRQINVSRNQNEVEVRIYD